MRLPGAALLPLLAALCACGPGPAPEDAGVDEAPEVAALDARFTDVTAASGIVFRHRSGARGRKLLPETMGSGAAFLDADGDGHLDLFLVNGGALRANGVDPGPDTRCRFFRGRGDGRFEDATEASGLGLFLDGMGAAAADVDADGDEDLFVTAVGDNRLLLNEGGRFRDVTAAAGVAGGRWRDAAGAEHPEWSTAALFADLDRDGDLDLFVGNYVQWAPDAEIFTTLDGTTKAFTTPDRYEGLPCRLFLNRGDGRFDDVTASAGLAPHRGKALGAAVWDFDDDGLLDVVVANDTRPNFLFRNLGGGRFREVGLEAGIAYDENGRARAGMGVDVGAGGEVAIGNFGREPMSLFRRTRDWGFEEVAARAGLAAATHAPLTFGLLFLDLDLDGREDLVLANGHIEPDIARFQPDQQHAQRLQVFHRSGRDRFVLHGPAPGDPLASPHVGRGLLWGDVDEDGDPDLLLTTNDGAPVLLRNDASPASRRQGVTVRLRGSRGNPRALGARLRFPLADGSLQARLVRTGSSYLSQSQVDPILGRGGAGDAFDLEVRWPDGETSRHRVEAPAGARVVIERP